MADLCGTGQFLPDTQSEPVVCQCEVRDEGAQDSVIPGNGDPSAGVVRFRPTGSVGRGTVPWARAWSSPGTRGRAGRGGCTIQCQTLLVAVFGKHRSLSSAASPRQMFLLCTE